MNVFGRVCLMSEIDIAKNLNKALHLPLFSVALHIQVALH